jgi:DNA helicase-2/ATP-dependent DNA helicase PcrA
MDKIFDSLNSSQAEAVKQIDGSVLILAGAGSGKTKTITSRVAYLIKNGIPPSSILTLTFTNKAANEMRNRALSLIDNDTSFSPLLCTFHKFGLLFLKFHMSHLNRDNSFVIIDTDDKKRIIKSFDVDLPIALITSEISRFKNNLITPDEAISSAQLLNYKKISNIYKKYEAYLEQNNLVDFDDLLALPYLILEQNPKLCEEISQKYKYIMVDEYQDTNDLQLKLLQKLTSTHQNICVVGDDDQSIYGWRGANIKNILEFHKQYDNTTIVKLETNYRSTDNILKVANELIEHNRSRHGKVLSGIKGEGKDVELISSDNENSEAKVIASRIRDLIDEGINPNNMAILYRINALSRSIEDGLNRAGISYKMVGGLKFYERAEIKDIISYLRLIANVNDDFSIKRVINKPKRGLGKATIDKLINGANEKNCSIFSYLKNESADIKGLVTKKSFETICTFVSDIEKLIESQTSSIDTLIDDIEDTFSIKDYYESLPNSQDRVLNIEEFYGLFRDFSMQHPSATLDEFLNDISLQSDQDQIEEDSVSVMSIHASKGLEFDHIFVIGLEEGFFPLLGEGTDLEEERRLGYVAFTRAKKELVLSTSSSRFYKGKRAGLAKSRFLSEAGLIKGSLKIDKSSSYKKGMLVKHKIFGVGRVIEVSKVKRETKLKINFAGTYRDILASFVERI